MSADNLPRPSTPGPWEAMSGEVLSDDRSIQAWFGNEQDAEAVAVIHERIRRMDAVRAQLDKAISVLEDPDPGVLFTPGTVLGVMRQMRSLLNGEGGDE